MRTAILEETATGTIQVPMNSEDPQDSSLVFPRVERRELSASTHHKSLVPPLVGPVRLAHYPRKLQQSTQPSVSAVATLKTDFVRELTPFPYKRTYAIGIPLPDWVSNVPDSLMTLEFHVQVPTSEIDEITANQVNDWTLTVDTGKLFAVVVPWVSALIVGSGLRPHAWTVAVAGFLAPVVTRPQQVTMTLGFRTQRTVNVLLDATVELNATSATMELTPSAAEEESGDESEDSWDLVLETG